MSRSTSLGTSHFASLEAIKPRFWRFQTNGPPHFKKVLGWLHQSKSITIQFDSYCPTTKIEGLKSTESGGSMVAKCPVYDSDYINPYHCIQEAE